MPATGVDVEDRRVAGVAPGSAFAVDSSMDEEENAFPTLARCDEVHVDGEKLHYESTGVVVENSLRNTCILTSSALVSTSDPERRFIYRLKIKLRLPNNQVVDGWIQHYDLPFSMVVVVTGYSPDLRTDGSGGPLVDLDGNIVGINDYHDQEGTPYVQGNKIDECLRVARIRDEVQRHCWQNFTSAFKRHWEGSSNENGYSGESESKNQKQFLSSNPEPQALEFTEDVPTPELIEDEHKRILLPWPSDGFTKMVNALLDKDGYPLPAYADGGMRLEGHFEEEFGRDNLSEPARKIALKMSRSVVALASFSHDFKKRHFACTGVCIDFDGSTSTTRVLTSASLVRTSGDENELFDNLKIRVCLPSNECIEGNLENFDFCYNVAIISFPFRCNRTAMLVDAPQTEAGIGGPLLDFKGNVVGMNFYDTEGTPYLPSKIILKVLRRFDNAERPVAAGLTEEPNSRPVAAGMTEEPNSSWPVLKPYWHYPSEKNMCSYKGKKQMNDGGSKFDLQGDGLLQILSAGSGWVYP
ncbi:hypothetical protein ACQ4PT_006157 [Festuca glaucescens]